MTTASLSLRSFARTWFGDHPELDVIGVPWEDFEKALHLEYDDELSQDKLFEVFMSLSQQNTKNRSITLYNSKFRETARQLGSALTDSFKLHSYIKGLSPRTRSDVQRSNPLSVEQAMLQASKSENIGFRNSGSSYDSYYGAGRSRQTLDRYDSRQVDYGDPMDTSLGQMDGGNPEVEEEESYDVPENPDELRQMAFDDPDSFYDAVDRLHIMARTQGRGNGRDNRRGGFRGRSRGGNPTPRGNSGGSRQDERPRAYECYVCGSPDHLAHECPKRYQLRKDKGLINQMADATDKSSGNETGQEM